MPTSTISLQNLIVQQAQAQGVPPEIALGVAKTESGISQWTPGGSVVTSSAGALGVFQLMPSTAAGLGVDPTDLNGNIQGGIAYLKQLYSQFGNWGDALAAYNWGPGNVSSGAPVPTSVGQYVSNVLASAGNYAAGLLGMSSPALPSVPAPDGTDLTAAGLESGISSNTAATVAIVGVLVVIGMAYLWKDL